MSRMQEELKALAEKPPEVIPGYFAQEGDPCFGSGLKNPCQGCDEADCPQREESFDPIRSRKIRK